MLVIKDNIFSLNISVDNLLKLYRNIIEALNEKKNRLRIKDNEFKLYSTVKLSDLIYEKNKDININDLYKDYSQIKQYKITTEDFPICLKILTTFLE